MLQVMRSVTVQPAALAGTQSGGVLSPAAMATYLRRTGGDAAPCFAQAMYDEAAWANEAWGAYWAEIVRLV